MASAGPFPREVLAGDTLDAARALLGARLVRDPGDGLARRVGRIVEVEAYIGPDDRASHARMGPTARNRVMFGPAGIAYVYLVYGMHHCLNVVTEREGTPAAILIRALEPVDGADAMRVSRAPAPHVPPTPAWPAAAAPAARLRGPRRRGLGLDPSTGLDLCDPASRLRLEPRPADEAEPGVVATPRVGIAFAGEPWVSLPWRLTAAGSPSLSGPHRPMTETRMDARSIALLEFPQVRARLAEKTSFDPSRRLAEVLEPSPDPVIVARALDETDQTRPLLQERAGVGIGSAHDIDPWIGRAARGGRLDAPQFLEIAETLDAAARLATNLAEERRPLLRDLGACPPAAGAAEHAHAAPSTRSASCSTQPRRAWAACARRRPRRVRPAPAPAGLARRRRSSASALQEPIITLRNGRYVVPVRAEARSKVKGIVHDASGSGQTLFVEPLVVVELGNAWREAQAAVDEEVGRILDELSALVAANADDARETLDALAQFDFWVAKAQLAAEMDGIRPAAADARRSSSCRRATRASPDGSSRSTSGSVTATRRSSSPAPTPAARRSRCGRWGCCRSCTRPASTSRPRPGRRCRCSATCSRTSATSSRSPSPCPRSPGHLRSIIRIVEHAGPGTLVLLDELGAGTDPTEGSALAQALLDWFIRSGALVAATTHYAEIKVYAHETPAARNANVEFNLETLSPTYRLTIGLPGGSQAFAIAERLGLPDDIVGDARGRLTENQAAFEATLASIQTQEREIGEAVDRARAAEARATEALRTAEEERRRARRERDEAVRAARAEAERLVEGLKDDVAGVRRRLERETVTAPAIDAALARAEQTLDRIPAATPVKERAPVAAPRTWRLGDRARSRSGGWEGRIAALEKGGTRATLEAGGMRVAVADLEEAVGSAGGGAGDPADRRSWRRRFAARPRDRARGSTAGSTISNLQLGRARTVASSLDLRGARVDEALEALGRYLDDASLAGLEQVLDHPRPRDGGAAGRRAASSWPRTRWSRASAPASGARAATARRSSGSSYGAPAVRRGVAGFPRGGRRRRRRRRPPSPGPGDSARAGSDGEAGRDRHGSVCDSAARAGTSPGRRLTQAAAPRSGPNGSQPARRRSTRSRCPSAAARRRASARPRGPPIQPAIGPLPAPA